MNEEIILSIKPKWCESIANGRKTIEIRKTRPKIDTPFTCYIYCTKPNQKEWGLCLNNGTVGLICKNNYDYAQRNNMPILSGKVIGEFVCDNIERMTHLNKYTGDYKLKLVDKNLYCKEISNAYLADCQLSYSDIFEYANGKDVYGWHISRLVIYDRPKELSEFKQCHKCPYYTNCTERDYSCDGTYNLSRPPQSWCYAIERF